jgi:Skp family chaperone for outer membrane proteins
MSRTVLVALPLAAAFVGGIALFSGHRPVGAAPEVPGRVAVVDVLEVINSAPRKAQIEADYKKAREGIEQFKRSERTRVEKEAGDIDIMPRTDPKRAERERALNRSMVLSEFDLKAKDADARKGYFDALENLWREVRAEVRKVATEGQYTVVVTKTEDELNVRSNEEFIINVAVRNVLYYSPGVDITPTVKQRMAARAGGAPPAPAGTVPGGTPPPPPSGLPPPQPNSGQPGR